jgi:hypothetical protein
MLARHYGPKKIPCLEGVKNTSASQGGGVFTQKSVADSTPRMEELLCYRCQESAHLSLMTAQNKSILPLGFRAYVIRRNC